MSNAKSITFADFNALKKTTNLVFIDFYATWCGPCKVMSPIIDTLAADPDLQSVSFYKCDVDEEGELSELFNVSSIPSFFLVKINGDDTFDPSEMTLHKLVGTKSAFDLKNDLMSKMK